MEGEIIFAYISDTLSGRIHPKEAMNRPLSFAISYFLNSFNLS